MLLLPPSIQSLLGRGAKLVTCRHIGSGLRHLEDRATAALAQAAAQSPSLTRLYLDGESQAEWAYKPPDDGTQVVVPKYTVLKATR